MTDTSNSIGRQNSGIAIDQAQAGAAQPGPENRPTGQINGQDFQENTENPRAPTLFGRAKKMFNEWRETRRDNDYVKNHTKHLNKISVQLPDPEAKASTRGEKHKAALERYDARVEQESEIAVKEGNIERFNDENLAKDYGRQLFVRMFGKDDPDTADALMSELLKPQNEDVRLRLNLFLSRNGSFETQKGVPGTHFGFDKETTVATISSSVLENVDSEAFVAVLNANLEYTRDRVIVVGELNIKARKAMKMRMADLNGLVHKPTLDMSQPAPPLYERKTASVHTQAGMVPAEKIEISRAYEDNPNYGAVINRLHEDTGAGMLNMHATPPTESEVTHIAMFGGDRLPPSASYLNGILADPDLKAALLTFLKDGGTFTLKPGENTRFVPMTNTIVIGGYRLDRDASRLEASLRDIFDVPLAPTHQTTGDAAAADDGNAPADVAARTDDGATQQTEVANAATEPRAQQTATTDDAEIDTGAPAEGANNTSNADTTAHDVGAIEPEQDDADLDDIVGEAQEQTGRPQYNTLHERRMQNYLDAIDKLNNRV